jgi:hypothetical protein
MVVGRNADRAVHDRQIRKRTKIRKLIFGMRVEGAISTRLLLEVSKTLAEFEAFMVNTEPSSRKRDLPPFFHAKALRRKAEKGIGRKAN